MVDIKTFKELALAFNNVSEQPHFEKDSFRVNKKIFATLDAKNKRVSLKLSEIDQSVYCSIDDRAIYPANGGWGKQGWTIVELNKVRKNILAETLKKSYDLVTSKK